MKILTLNVKIKTRVVAPDGLRHRHACEIYTLMNQSRAAGEIIRARRVQAGLTLDDLADCLAITPAEMSRKETGKSSISLDQLEKLALRLGTSLEQVLQEARRDRTVDPDKAEWDALYAELPAEDRRALIRLAKRPTPKRRRLKNA